MSGRAKRSPRYPRIAGAIRGLCPPNSDADPNSLGGDSDEEGEPKRALRSSNLPEPPNTYKYVLSASNRPAPLHGFAFASRPRSWPHTKQTAPKGSPRAIIHQMAHIRHIKRFADSPFLRRAEVDFATVSTGEIPQNPFPKEGNCGSANVEGVFLRRGFASKCKP